MASVPAQIQQQAAAIVLEFPGHAFCASCLAQKLGTDVGLAVEAVTALAQTEKFDREQWFCSFCLRVEQVVHVPWLERSLRAGSGTPPAPDPLRFHARPGA